MFDCLKCLNKTKEIKEEDNSKTTNIFFCEKCFVFWDKKELLYYKDYKEFKSYKPKEVVEVLNGDRKRN